MVTIKTRNLEAKAKTNKDQIKIEKKIYVFIAFYLFIYIISAKEPSQPGLVLEEEALSSWSWKILHNQSSL